MPLTKPGSIQQIRDLPTPKGQFLLGHLPAFQKGPKHRVLEKWAEECGDLFRIRLGLATFVVSTDPSFNAEVLKQRPASFRRHPKISEILEEIGVYSVFNAEGERWYWHRKPVAEALNLKKVKSFYPLLVQKAEQLVKICQQSAQQSEQLDVRSLIQRFTLDLTTVVAFGCPLNTLAGEEDKLHSALQLVFPTVNRRMSSALPTWRWWKTGADRDFDDAVQYIRASVQEFIDKAQSLRVQTKDPSYQASNFLEALLDGQDSSNLSDKDIFSAVFTLLLAGEDTTANSISWSLLLLAQHPAVVDRIRAEAHQVYGELAVPNTVKQLQELQEAIAVAQETIRLKPTSPQLILQAKQQQVINGLEVPDGTNVIVQNRYAQSKEIYFSNADQFLPERWKTGGCPAGWNHQTDIVRTFGAGVRYCPGKHLAMHEMIIVISSLCKHFDIELVEEAPTISEAYTFTMHPEQFHVRLRSVKA